MDRYHQLLYCSRVSADQGPRLTIQLGLDEGTLVSQGCHNKVPQTRWLETTEIYSLPVLDAKSSKSSCQHGHTPPETLGRVFLASSSFWWRLLIVGIPWLSAASLKPLLCLPMPSSLCVSLSLCPFSSLYKDTCHIGLRAHPTSVCPHLN